jgi:hypothetical protein
VCALYQTHGIKAPFPGEGGVQQATTQRTKITNSCHTEPTPHRWWMAADHRFLPGGRLALFQIKQMPVPLCG